MVDIGEPIAIGGDHGPCMGVSPGRVENELICSFCNGMIAVYDVYVRRFVKNWQLCVSNTLTVHASYHHSSDHYRAVQNSSELIEWSHDMEWASEFSVIKLQCKVHSLLTTPSSVILVYANGRIESLDPCKVISDGRNMSVVQAVYCGSSGHVIVTCLVSQYIYQCYVYSLGDDLTETASAELKTKTLGDLVAMETSGAVLLTAWSSGPIVRMSIDNISLEDGSCVTCTSGITGFTGISSEYFSLIDSSGELSVFSTQYGTVECKARISSDTSAGIQQLTCCHGNLFVCLSNDTFFYPLVVSKGLTLATVLGKREKRQTVSYQWINDDDDDGTLGSKMDLIQFRRLLKDSSPLVWSRNSRVLSRLTVLIEDLFNEEVWPHNELLSIVEADIFPVNLTTSLLEHCLTQTDWGLLVATLRHVHDLSELILVDILVTILDLENEVIKLSKKETVTKSELISLVLSFLKNDTLIQQPLTRLSHDHVLLLLNFLAERLDGNILTPTPTPVLRYDDALDWFGLLLDTHFTRLILVPEVRPLLLKLRRRIKDNLLFLSRLEVLGGVKDVRELLLRAQETRNWNYRVDKIDLKI